MHIIVGRHRLDGTIPNLTKPTDNADWKRTSQYHNAAHKRMHGEYIECYVLHGSATKVHARHIRIQELVAVTILLARH